MRSINGIPGGDLGAAVNARMEEVANNISRKKDGAGKAESVRLREALRQAAEDLRKAADQFEALGFTSIAQVFAECEIKARATLDDWDV